MQKEHGDLPSLKKAAVPKDQAREKHYYMLLTLASHGVLACVAMQSGTSGKMQDRSRIKFWFDRLVEFGIGTAEEEQRQRERVWVRTALHDLLDSAHGLAEHC